MAQIIEFPIHRDAQGRICCINNCGAVASHYYELAEIELRNGELVPWRAAGKKYFCEVCAPSDASPVIAEKRTR